MRFSLSSSHALLEMKCDMQISYEMVSNAHVHQLTVSLLRQQARVRLHADDTTCVIKDVLT